MNGTKPKTRLYFYCNRVNTDQQLQKFTCSFEDSKSEVCINKFAFKWVELTYSSKTLLILNNPLSVLPTDWDCVKVEARTLLLSLPSKASCHPSAPRSKKHKKKNQVPVHRPENHSSDKQEQDNSLGAAYVLDSTAVPQFLYWCRRLRKTTIFLNLVQLSLYFELHLVSWLGWAVCSHSTFRVF